MEAISVMKRSAMRGSRRGFTLVEILTVVVIIGILVGLVSAAAIHVRGKAIAATITMEISQFDQAMKEYRAKYGDYPPCFAGVNDSDADIQLAARGAVLRHLRKAYPRYRLDGNQVQQWDQFRTEVQTATEGLDVELLDPASALVFWLGGLPTNASQSTQRVRGRSSNPSNPFDNSSTREPTLFEFDGDRIRFTNSDGSKAGFSANGYPMAWPKYYCRKNAEMAPYVYFKPTTNQTTGEREYGYVVGSSFMPYTYVHGSENICVPYLEPPKAPAKIADQLDFLSDADPRDNDAPMRAWPNAKTYQLISPGMDGMFGNGEVNDERVDFRFSKAGYFFSEDGGDADNLTNFSGGTLEDALDDSAI